MLCYNSYGMVLWIAIYFFVTLIAHCLSLSGDRRDWLITSWIASSKMAVHCETWLTSMYCTTCISFSEQANTRMTKLSLNSGWMSQIKIKQKKFQWQSYLWIFQPGKTAKTNFSLAQRVTSLLHIISKYVRLSFILKNRFPRHWIWSLQHLK